MQQMGLSLSPQDLVRKLEFNLKSYPRFGTKQIFGMDVILIEVKGDCCWAIYSGMHFKDNFQFLRLGFIGQPNFEIMSMLKAECV
jgi:hypothetical protein